MHFVVTLYVDDCTDNVTLAHNVKYLTFLSDGLLQNQYINIPIAFISQITSVMAQASSCLLSLHDRNMHNRLVIFKLCVHV